MSYFIKKYFGFSVNKLFNMLLHKGIHQLKDAVGVTGKNVKL